MLPGMLIRTLFLDRRYKMKFLVTLLALVASASAFVPSSKCHSGLLR